MISVLHGMVIYVEFLALFLPTFLSVYAQRWRESAISRLKGSVFDVLRRWQAGTTRDRCTRLGVLDKEYLAWGGEWTRLEKRLMRVSCRRGAATCTLEKGITSFLGVRSFEGSHTRHVFPGTRLYTVAFLHPPSPPPPLVHCPMKGGVGSS